MSLNHKNSKQATVYSRQTGYIAEPDGANGMASLMELTGVVSPVEGYIFVYLTNESNEEVYFDDLEVRLKESNVVQSNNYYPFGLRHATSWSRISSVKNNFLYNAGTELNQRTKNYETYFREYDPALGRFNQIDPLAASFTNQTPYNYAFNNPIALDDPKGDKPGCANCSYVDEYHTGYGDFVRGSYEFSLHNDGSGGWIDEHNAMIGEVNAHYWIDNWFANAGFTKEDDGYWNYFEGNGIRSTAESYDSPGNTDIAPGVSVKRPEFIEVGNVNTNGGNVSDWAKAFTSPLIGTSITYLQQATDDILRGATQLSRAYSNAQNAVNATRMLQGASTVAGVVVIDNILKDNSKSDFRKVMEISITATPWAIEALAATGVVAFGSTPVGWFAAGVGLIGTAGIMVYDGVYWGMEQIADFSVQVQNAYNNGWRPR